MNLKLRNNNKELTELSTLTVSIKNIIDEIVIDPLEEKVKELCKKEGVEFDKEYYFKMGENEYARVSYSQFRLYPCYVDEYILNRYSLPTYICAGFYKDIKKIKDGVVTMDVHWYNESTPSDQTIVFSLNDEHTFQPEYRLDIPGSLSISEIFPLPKGTSITKDEWKKINSAAEEKTKFRKKQRKKFY